MHYNILSDVIMLIQHILFEVKVKNKNFKSSGLGERQIELGNSE